MSTGVIQDNFRHHYRLHIQGDVPVSRFLSAKRFSDSVITENFVRGLRVPPGFWRGALSRVSVTNFKPGASVEARISALLIRGTLKLYPVKHLDTQPGDDSPAEASTPLATVKGMDYKLAPASVLLVQPASDVKTFANKEQAISFLTEMNMDDAQTNELAASMGISSAGTSQPPGAQTAAMAQVLLENQFVVVATPARVIAQPESSADNAPTEKTSDSPSTLGPHEEQGGDYTRESSAAVAVAAALIAEEILADETKPPCTLEKVVIKCSHGSSVEITKETLEPPTLNVVATETDKAGFDLISAEIQASELCPSHKSSSFNISKEHTLNSKTESKIEFKVNCSPWKRSNVFERLWLPSVKPKIYGLTIKDTCEAPDINVKKVNINVYPDIKWHWSTKIDFGKLEFIPGKAKVKYSDFAIDGNVDLTYDGEKHDAKEKYKKYIQKPLDGFKKICDSVSKVLEVINNPQAALTRIGTQTTQPKPAEGEDNSDGNETRLIIDWPKLNIDYDSTFIENTSTNVVDHDYSIKLTAKPLLEIDIQVDVLDSMISLAPLPVAELIRYARKRVEQDFEEDQEVGLRGELDIIFTVKATININESEIKGRQNAAENNVSVEPVKGDIKIPAQLKGAVKAEGKWFVISFSVHYEMSGDTEWSGNYEFGSDDTGIYFSNTVEFKGINITLTKYEEVKAALETDTKRKKEVSVDDFLSDIELEIKPADEASIKLEDGQVKGEATAKAKEEKRWSWLKPNEDAEKQQPTKHYIVKR